MSLARTVRAGIAQHRVRPQAFLLLGQQRIDEFRLRGGLRARMSLRKRTSEIRTVIARLVAMDASPCTTSY